MGTFNLAKLSCTLNTLTVEDAVLPTDNDPWIFRELGQAQFGDARLTRRAMINAQDLMEHPDLSLASIDKGNSGDLRAGYRFFDNAAVKPAAILAPHRAAPDERSGMESLGLIAQDPCYFHCSSHEALEGVGPIESLDDKGILVQTALAMTTQGVPIGLTAPKIWIRDPAEFGKGRQRKQRPLAEKESTRWLEIAQEAASGVPDGTRAVIMGDRESDIYDVFAEIRERALCSAYPKCARSLRRALLNRYPSPRGCGIECDLGHRHHRCVAQRRSSDPARHSHCTGHYGTLADPQRTREGRTRNADRASDHGERTRCPRRHGAHSLGPRYHPPRRRFRRCAAFGGVVYLSVAD